MTVWHFLDDYVCVMVNSNYADALSWKLSTILKFIYSEKAIKFCEIFTLLLSYVVPVKNKLKISQSYVAFSEYMNFNYNWKY